MVIDTLSFMFIIVCCMVILASVFTTLFQDINEDLYGGMFLTIRSMFDIALGGVEWTGYGDR